MGEHGKDAKPFRVRTYAWDASDEEDPQACELLVSDWIEAANAREAAATAKLDHVPAHVDRRLVESAEQGMVGASPPTAAVPEIEEVAPEGPPERELICDLLLRLAQAQTPDLASLAEEHDCSVFTAEQSRSIERWGLALPASEGYPASLLHAGEQFLTRRGHVPVETLEFLAGSPIDDLHAREALRRASSLLIDELAHTHVPPAI